MEYFMQTLNRFFVTLTILLSISFSAFAQVKVVVIPLGADEKCDPCYSTTITVAPSGADFTSPSAALASIGKGVPHANNRLLIKIATGLYTITETLDMIEYVDIEGAGIGLPDGTILSGTPTFNGELETAAIINGASNTELRNMSVINNGGNCSNFAMYNNNRSPIVRKVYFGASGSGGGCDAGGWFNSGIVNRGAFTFAKFYDVISSGMTDNAASQPAFGIHNSNGAFSIAESSEFSGEGDDGKSVALVNDAVAVFVGGVVDSGNSVLSGSIIKCIDTQDFSSKDLDSSCYIEA
ncbi:MAG: hypothetical protein ACI9FR_003215 [Cryomorphaceae bacterium]|jgi:hypothetical protein